MQDGYGEAVCDTPPSAIEDARGKFPQVRSGGVGQSTENLQLAIVQCPLPSNFLYSQ